LKNVIETIADTASTNADMLQRAGAGAPEGLWLRAEQQSGGRGRLGRSWSSPSGNLYCSTIVRIRDGDPPAPSLAFVAGLAVVLTANKLIPAANARLKWPNDVQVNRAKLAGILLERRNDAVVVGIGMNVRVVPQVADKDVTSLCQEGAHIALTPADIIEELAFLFAHVLSQWREAGLGTVLAQWQSLAHSVGEPLTVNPGGRDQLTGLYDGLQSDGALRLKLPDGKIEIITAGDVELLHQA
jgi:BirA family biotin operon repressor/biotin-[acetyl-CoA-carboxylase] ligase